MSPRPIGALALALLLPLCGRASAQGETRPAFEVVLWLDGSTTRDPALWARLCDLGFTAASLSRGQDPAPLRAAGLGFYADQVAGKGELELRKEQWQSWFDGYVATRLEERLARPACLADDAVRASLIEKVGAQALFAREAGAFAASIADEPSATSHFNPLDACRSTTFLAAYRSELRRRYHDDPRALGTRWGTALGDFSQIEPETTAEARRRELRGPGLPRNLAAWNDQLEFTDRLFVDACQAAFAASRFVAPDLPVGLTGMQPPSAFGGYDYRRLMRGQGFFEVYDIGGARDLAAAVADPSARQFATLFPPKVDEDPNLLAARISEMLAHGLAGIIVWSSKEAADGAQPTAYAERIGAALRELREVSPVFAGARIERSPVWIVESQPAIRVQWMLDSWSDGDTWPRRLSSYEAQHGTSLAARAGWIALLRDLGLQPDFVFAEDLAARLPAERPRLLVLGDTIALADDGARAIETFVAAGGHVVADHGVAVYDEALHLRQRGALDDLFGIRERQLQRADWLVRNARGSDDLRTEGGVAIAERGLRGELAEPLDAADVQLEKSHGEGRATLLNLAVCEYPALRLDPKRFAAARELRARLRQVLHAAAVSPPFFVRGEGLPTCIERAVLRARDGRRLAAIRFDLLDDQAQFAAFAKGGEREVELVFPTPVRVTDLRAGVALSAEPSCKIRLSPVFGAFLLLEPAR